MYVVAVTIWIKPEFTDRFIEATLDNARNTRKEPGNLRFDVLRAEEDPNKLMLYEVYHAKEDLAKHHQTPHYFRWRDTVTEWMAQPRQAVRHHTLFYGDE